MRNKLALAAILVLLITLPAQAQTIRPTRISQLRLTQLTTAQEGTMTLVEGDTWYNTDLNCKRLRLSASSVCMLEGGGTSDAIIKTPTADQRIAGNFNLFAAKIHSIRFVDPSGEFTTIQAALDDSGALVVYVPTAQTISTNVTVGNDQVLILAPGTYTMGNSGQITLGGVRSKLWCIGGPENTILDVPATYTVTTGVIQLTSGEPSATVEGCQIRFAQPDTAVRANLTQYTATAIDALAEPRFQIRNVRITRAWNGIDMTGNSGGAVIDNLRMSAFNIGIDIDGALDIVRIRDLHFHSFDLTANQLVIFQEAATIGIRSGRCDGLDISGSHFISGTHLQLNAGPTFGYISNTNFDAFNAITMSAGRVEIAASHFSLNDTDVPSINLTGGTLSISASEFETAGATSPSRMITVSGAADLQLSGSYLRSGSFDVTHVHVTGSTSEITLTGNKFFRASGTAYTNPTIDAETGTRVSAVGNVTRDKGAGAGTFITIAQDNNHVIVGNRFTGWAISLPATLSTMVVVGNILPSLPGFSWYGTTAFAARFIQANSAARAYTLQDSSDTLVGRATTDTLTNKTLTTPVIAVANPLEGALSNEPRWIFKQVDHTDMTAAATADTFTLWTLPANTMIHDVVGTVVSAWAGTGPVSAAVCSVGTAAGGATDLALDDNFFATGTRYELHDATASGGKGALLFDSTDKFAPFMLVASGDIEIQCDLTGGDHDNTSAGQARIYILVSQPLGNTTTEAN